MSYDPYADKTLTEVGTAAALLSYEFDQFSVFKRVSDGALFWAATSGCSCGYPFDYCESLDDFSTGTAQEAHAALDEYVAEGYHSIPESEVAELHLAISQV